MTYKKKIEQYIEQGYTDVIVITLSSGISSYYSTVQSIAKDEKRIKVHPFDSKITCAGEADYAMLAGRLVEAGADIDLIMHDLTDLQKTNGCALYCGRFESFEENRSFI